MQREIEAAGLITITLTPVPELTASVSVPRIAAIEYPLGRTLGQPGDATGQLAVLRATLCALEAVDAPGRIVHLPFEWREPPGQASKHSTPAPPIVKYLQRHPWHLPNLFTRNIPK